MKISVLGATGSMGGLIIKTALQEGLEISGKVSSKNSISELFDDTDTIIDFSCPLATKSMLEYALQSESIVPVIIGTTGLSDECIDLMKACSRNTPVFYSPNMSFLISIVNMAVYAIGKLLDDTFDVEVSETHHRLKKDAPSGTALMLGNSVAKSRGVHLSDVAVFDRHGIVQQRKQGDIGFCVRRCGKVVGELEVSFVSDNEEITVSHKAFSNEIFAKSVIKTVRWLVAQSPALYTMNDFTKDMIVPVVKDLYKDFFSLNRNRL